MSAPVGGAYVYLKASNEHAILINMMRINMAQLRALEIVVAEEVIHMRDHLDGDFRRHAKHGYDRIARRVAELTGASLHEVRSCVLPRTHRSVRYIYACPSCGIQIQRRKTGVWSCGRCAPTFDRRYVLRMVKDLREADGVNDTPAGADGALARNLTGKDRE
jgi:ribosomal protein L37AE/L43A